MTIGERITYLRTRKGLTKSALARHAAIGQSTLHGYEAGTRTAEGMAVAIAKRLAVTLGVTLDYLCGMYEGALVEPQSPTPPAAPYTEGGGKPSPGL